MKRLGKLYSVACVVALSSLSLGLVRCSSFPPGLEPGDAGSSGNEAAPGDGGGDVVVPPGCDPLAEPKDAPKCVVSDFGVFVDGAGGSDGNAGTKASPVKTLAAALSKLAGKSRVYGGISKCRSRGSGDLDAVGAAVDDHVLGLEVAMHDAEPVRGYERTRDLVSLSPAMGRDIGHVR